MIQRKPGGDGHREPRQGQTHITILMDKQTSKAESSAVTNPTDTGNPLGSCPRDTRCPPAPRAQRSGFSLLRLTAAPAAWEQDQRRAGHTGPRQ